MKEYFSKFITKERSPLTISYKDSFIGFIGGLITVGILAYLGTTTNCPWIIAPFGASCVLAFGVWSAPLSQPRNIIGGHLISSFIGIVIFNLLGNSYLSLGLGVGLAIGAMLLTKTTHPPAGADPIVVILAGSNFGFLIHPILLGSIIIVVIAGIINNLSKDRKYPTFWL